MRTRATIRQSCLALVSEHARGRWPNAAGPEEHGPLEAGGFTLLEVLVALAVLGLIMGAVYGSYRAVTTSIVDLEPRMDLDQKGRFFLQRLSRQVRCCYGGRQDQANQPVQDQNDVKKAVSQEQTRFFQGGRTLSDDVALRFVTTSSTLNRKSDVGCLTVISYKVDPLQHALLIREEIYGRQSTNEENDKDWRVVLDDVSEVEFQYFDGMEWRKEWDSSVAGFLPRALRVNLVLESKQAGISASFASVVATRCNGTREPKAQVQGAVSPGKDRGQTSGRIGAHAQ
jgi:general secretion pathway protein J